MQDIFNNRLHPDAIPIIVNSLDAQSNRTRRNLVELLIYGYDLEGKFDIPVRQDKVLEFCYKNNLLYYLPKEYLLEMQDILSKLRNNDLIINSHKGFLEKYGYEYQLGNEEDHKAFFEIYEAEKTKLFKIL